MKASNILTFVSRILTGSVFIFSGIVKGIDPIGTQIKFEDYFSAMGLDALAPAALLFSFVMNAAEIIIGLMLFLNMLPKFATYVALLLMLIFTPLTLWLAVANPVTDCGCFGDFIKLTNWQTFWKNIVIDGFLLVLFFNRKQIESSSSRGFQYAVGVFAILFAFGFQFYNFRNLPIVDFRAYKEGANITEQMIVPEGAPKDEYKTALYYKNIKTKKIKEFTLENAPYEDSLNWEFDTTTSVLIKEGYEPPIHDFRITSLEGTDITDFVLKDETPVFVLVSYDLAHANLSDTAAFNRIAKFAISKKKQFVCFTGSGQNDIDAVKQNMPNSLRYFNADKKVLKTMIRSNPGLILLQKGTILKKWHYRNIPSNKELEKLNITDKLPELKPMK